MIVKTQELESAWDKIDQVTAEGRTVMDMSRDIKSELGEFYKKVDESAQLTSDDHRRYDDRQLLY